MTNTTHPFLFTLLLFLFCIASLSVLAQNGWEYLPNAPASGYRWDDIYFYNDSTGCAVNGDGSIWRTNDYGNSWQLVVFTGEYFRSVEFINDSVGFTGTLNGTV